MSPASNVMLHTLRLATAAKGMLLFFRLGGFGVSLIILEMMGQRL